MDEKIYYVFIGILLGIVGFFILKHLNKTKESLGLPTGREYSFNIGFDNLGDDNLNSDIDSIRPRYKDEDKPREWNPKTWY